MEEIRKNIFIERMFPSMTVGALKFEDRLFFVDAPTQKADVGSWRKQFSGLANARERMLLMLDTHVDRTLGIQGMSAVVLAHENAVEIMKNRSASAQFQDLDGGADCDPSIMVGNIEWVEPDITYTTSACVHWDETPLVVTHQPGSHCAGSWLRYDAEDILFVGDSVMTKHAPFLGWADLDQWLSDLIWLRTGTFSDYTIISSRQGVVDHDAIEVMIDLISDIKPVVEALVDEVLQPVDISAAAMTLLSRRNFDQESIMYYRDRMIWGLEKYLQRHASKSSPEQEGA